MFIKTGKTWLMMTQIDTLAPLDIKCIGDNKLNRYGELLSICLNVLEYVVMFPKGNKIVRRGNQIENWGKEIKSQGYNIVTQANMVVSQEQKGDVIK